MSSQRGVRSALVGNYVALAIALVSQVVLLPLLLARVGPSVAGTFVLLWSAVNFAAIGIGWLSSGGVVLMTRAAARGDTAALAGIYRRFALIMAGYAAFVWLALLGWSMGIGSLWLRTLTPAEVQSVRWASHGAGLYVAAVYVHQADLALFTARLQQGLASGFRALLQLLMSALALAAIAGGAGVAGMFAGYAIAAVLTATAAHITLRASGGYPAAATASDASGSMRELLGTFAGYSIVTVLLQYADVAIIGALSGPETTIVFAFLQRLPDAAALLVGRGSESLGPYFTSHAGRGERDELRALFLTSGRVVWRLAVLAGCGFAIFGRDLVGWWSQNRLPLPQAWYFAGAGVVIAAAIINRHAALLAYYGGETAAATRLAAIELAIRACLVVVLFSATREQAPMLAALLAQCVVLFIAYRRLEARILNIRVSEVLHACARPAAITAGVTLLVMLTVRVLGGTDVRGRVIAVALATVSAVTVLIAQERALGRSLLRRRLA